MARDGPFAGHPHFWERAMSRRQFLAASAAASGAAITSPLWMPAIVEASGADPVPIPPNPGFFGYSVSGGPGAELSSIFNFRGVTGMATVQGKGTGWNTATRKKTRYSFDSDNRFMQGEYIAVNGRRHRGTFGFVWLDIYVEGQVDPLADGTHQRHDFDPGITPDGLFWTFRIPNNRVRVEAGDLDHGASLSLQGLSLLDYGTLANALLTHATEPVRASASFTLRWSGSTGNTSATDPGPNRFTYEGIFTHARLAWSARVPSQHFAFQSDPASTSFETFAALVNERNGSFSDTDDD